MPLARYHNSTYLKLHHHKSIKVSIHAFRLRDLTSLKSSQACTWSMWA